jgi:hypothetical protein
LRRNRAAVPVLAGFSGPVPDHLGVNGAGDAVVQLGIKLRELVRRIDRRFRDVSDGSSLHDVPDDELANGLVLGASPGTICASDIVDVATAVLGSACVASFDRHGDLKRKLGF